MSAKRYDLGAETQIKEIENWEPVIVGAFPAREFSRLMIFTRRENGMGRKSKRRGPGRKT